MKKDNIKRILVLNFGGIGDEILFFPTLKTLRSSFAKTHITLVCEPRSACAKQLTDTIDDVILCDVKSKDKFINLARLIIKCWFSNFDIIVSSGSTKLVAILLFLTGIKKRYGYNSGKLSEILLSEAVPLNKNQYAADMYHDLTKAISPDSKSTIPEITVPAENLIWAKEKIGNRDKKIIIIHPGVSKLSIKKGIFKSWGASNWIEFIKKLLETGEYKVVLAGGPDDETIYNQIRAEIAMLDYPKEDIVDLYGKTKSLQDLAAIIKLADIMVCVDSAPMHVSVGVRTKTIALFGPMDETKLVPLYDFRFKALRKGEFHGEMVDNPPEGLEITVGNVLKTVESLL